jgi:hypothetical protein
MPKKYYEVKYAEKIREDITTWVWAEDKEEAEEVAMNRAVQGGLLSGRKEILDVRATLVTKKEYEEYEKD